MSRLFSLLFCLFFTKVLFADPFVYVCGGGSRSSNVITVIDAATNQVVATINGLDTPYAIAITPDGSKAAVSSKSITDPEAVFIIDTATNSLIKTISGEGEGLAEQIAITPDGKEVYATAGPYPEFNIFSYNLETYSVSNISTPSAEAIAIQISPDGKYAYVLDAYYTLWQYDFATASPTSFPSSSIVDTIALAISPDGKTVYVSNGTNNLTANSIIAFDVATQTAKETIFLGTLPAGIALNSDGTKLLAAAPKLPGVIIVDLTNNNQTTVPFTYTGAAPFSIAITGSTAYVGDNSNNVVTALTFDATEIIATINNVPSSHSSQAIAITPIKLPPPAQVSVRVCQNKNKFLTQTEYYNVINWNIPTTITPVSYQVYRDPDLTCLAGCVACPTFCDHNVKKCCAYTYYIVALLEDGTKTLIGQTSIR